MKEKLKTVQGQSNMHCFVEIVYEMHEDNLQAVGTL